jgi:micrococcal nuclease
MILSNLHYLFRFLTFSALLGVSSVSYAQSLNCPCRVVEVLAGDTVYIENHSRSSRKVWMAGIDAPQLTQLYGEQSRRNLSELLLGKNVELETIQRDRYGRITARLIKDGQDINLQQIKDGYAWYYREEDGLSDSLKDRYFQAEQEARKNTLGLWESRAIPPWEYREQ